MQFFERLIAAGEEAGLQKLRVRLVATRDCFVHLPPHLASQLLSEATPLPLVLLLKELPTAGSASNGGKWHVSWAGQSSSQGVIDIPVALAECLSLPEGITVSVQPLHQVPEATTVAVEPASEDDWELVEIYANQMEEQLLNQVGLVQAGQPFPFWVSPQTVLYLRVAAAQPASLAKLGRGVELAVAPRPRHKARDVGAGPESGSSLPDPEDVVWLRMNVLPSVEALEVRRASGSSASTSGQESAWHTCDTTTILVHRLAEQGPHFEEGQLVAVAPGLSSRSRWAVARLQWAPGGGAMPQASLAPCVLASVQLRHHNTAAVWPLDRLGPLPARLVLHPVAGGSSKALGAFRALSGRDMRELLAAWVEQQAACIPGVSSGGKGGDRTCDIRDSGVPLQDGSVVQLSCSPDDVLHLFVEQRGNGGLGVMKQGLPFLIKPAHVLGGEVRIELGEEVEIPAWEQAIAPPAVRKPVGASFGEEWTEKNLLPCIRRALPLLHHPTRQVWWKLRAPAPGGLLICGPSGSGKSALTAMLSHVLETHPQCRVHVVHVDCQAVETDTLSTAKEQLEGQLQEAVDCSPSLVVFDNLHLLCPERSAAPEAAPSTGTAALVRWLCDVLDSFRRDGQGRPPLPVVACATVPNATDLAEQLRASGRLDHCITLQAPSSQERRHLVESTFASRGIQCDALQMQAFASKADGYDAADLLAVVERATHAALKRLIRSSRTLQPGEALSLEQADLEAALEGFTPASSWGLGQGAVASNLVSGWEDVGGLADVREALQEALELPTKFAKLLATAPLRLRTGVLLYGPPGCGKTHVVGAAVASAGARFMSVKGPELLNKYIGASEAAVRDVFRQASAAAPCVLFFDEFDAIAPQRGHDSTGVTDRVVNQLLTELDGVEGLKGVVVIAATSRPDLLDGALLRPGRLDRLIYCGLPDANERLAILRALSRRLPLAPDVNLAAIAAKTADFTGADLGALLADSQLASVHALLASKEPNSHMEGGPAITGRNLEAALVAARPSLSLEERLRLDAVYSKFRNSRQPGVGNKDTKGKGLRTTLA